MIAVLKQGTTPAQTQHLVSWLKAMNLDVHVSEGAEVTVLGLIVVGALTASFVTCNLNIDIKTAAQVFDSASGTYVEGVISVFNLDNLLNNVFPHIVPLALTLGLFFLMKKKNWKPVTCIALLLVIGLVGAFFGIFA